jgi:PRTRC genetic system ThiF family protein
MRVHYTDTYLLNPPHKVTVDLVGLGGTGSQVLTNLGRINHALVALNHPGLHVRCWDDDIVSDANIGRQLFSHSDIGLNKAVVLTTRINRYYGTEWEARPVAYTGTEYSNYTISCVDSAMARLMIDIRLEGGVKKKQPTDRPIYWLDIGNLQKTGQVCLGTVTEVKQPKEEKNTRSKLPDVVKVFPMLKKVKEEKQGPSCSLAEALTKQDLFINSVLAQFGCNLIWKQFREGVIKHQGCFVNLESMNVNPIKIK